MKKALSGRASDEAVCDLELEPRETLCGAPGFAKRWRGCTRGRSAGRLRRDGPAGEKDAHRDCGDAAGSKRGAHEDRSCLERWLMPAKAGRAVCVTPARSVVGVGLQRVSYSVLLV